MPLPVVLQLEVQQYADFQRVFTFLIGPSRAAATPVPFSGYTALLEIRMEPSDSSPLVSISTTPNAQGSLVLGASDGTVTVTIVRAAVNVLPLEPWPPLGYGLILTSSSNIATTYLRGPVTVIGGYAHD